MSEMFLTFTIKFNLLLALYSNQYTRIYPNSCENKPATRRGAKFFRLYTSKTSYTVFAIPRNIAFPITRRGRLAIRRNIPHQSSLDPLYSSEYSGIRLVQKTPYIPKIFRNIGSGPSWEGLSIGLRKRKGRSGSTVYYFVLTYLVLYSTLQCRMLLCIHVHNYAGIGERSELLYLGTMLEWVSQ